MKNSLYIAVLLVATLVGSVAVIKVATHSFGGEEKQHYQKHLDVNGQEMLIKQAVLPFKGIVTACIPVPSNSPAIYVVSWRRADLPGKIISTALSVTSIGVGKHVTLRQVDAIATSEIVPLIAQAVN
jgi:hypothetical protein